jgi:DNA polymerase I
MVQLHKILNPNVARMIGSVHDSILFEIRDEAVEELLPVIIRTMETLPLEEEFGCLLTVPIKADAKVGRFWSEGAEEVSMA